MRIELRDVQPNDKERMRNWRNQPDVAKYLFTDHEISIEEHERWFNRISNDPAVKYWIIVVNDKDVGVVYLYNIDKRHKRCYWAFYIAEEDVRGRGVGSTVEYKILSYAFDKLKMDKIYCEVLAYNEPALRVYKKFGFREEGYFKKHILKGGKREDIYCLAILRDEWEKNKGIIEKQLLVKAES